ncbi:MAG: phosphate acyltransferase PlsX [Oscillospiraceae bacterium]|jgi:glycerol-3-phosphate acyltransferase PlsX|nr:phosphate acyltransferase PlsX [Oscillospiraceae bacterium]
MRLFTIAVDAMGGDYAPEITVRGSLEALRALPDLSIRLVGREEALRPFWADAGDVLPRLTILDAREVIQNTESPVMALRQKKDASLVRALELVRGGEAGALVSAGSTGAVMAGAMFRLGRLSGIERPALAALLPTVTGGNALLVDVGANVDCQPDWLCQFARMGAIYMRQVLGIENPRVALLSVGEEDEKGNQQTKAAFPMLKASGLNFIGNIEGRGVPLGETDIVVADGFAGNVLLKTMEGLSKAIFSLIKQELTATPRAQAGALLVKPALMRLKQRLNADEVGGAPLLGTQGAVVKAHGNSNAHAFACAIRQAYKMLEGDVVGLIRREIAEVNQ